MDYELPKSMQPLVTVIERVADKEKIAEWKAKADSLTPEELMVHQQKSTAITFKMAGMMEAGIDPESPAAQKVFKEAYELATSVNHASKEECLKTLLILEECPEMMSLYDNVAPGFSQFLLKGYKKFYNS